MMSAGAFVRGYPPAGAIIGRKSDLPNYCADLNAIHEAEKVLSDSQRRDYKTNLGQVKANEVGCYKDGDCMTIWNSTSRQRAEAFLKTIGKWKE